MYIRPRKLVVTGYACHGKDTFAKALVRASQGQLRFYDASQVACEEIIWPLWGHRFYESVEDCYKDRRMHRAQWYDLFAAYNKDDPARFGRLFFRKSDIYCGLRNIRELRAMREERLIGAVIWIDAYDRLRTIEHSSSITIRSEDADFYIGNNHAPSDMDGIARFLWSRMSLEPAEPR